MTLVEKPAESTTLFHNIMKCDVDIRENLHVHVMLPGGTTLFQWIFEHITKELTVFSSKRSRCLPHQCESTLHVLECLSCSSQHIPADVDFDFLFGLCITMSKKKKGDKLCLADNDLPYVNRGSLTFGPTQRRVCGCR